MSMNSTDEYRVDYMALHDRVALSADNQSNRQK